MKHSLGELWAADQPATRPCRASKRLISASRAPVSSFCTLRRALPGPLDLSFRPDCSLESTLSSTAWGRLSIVNDRVICWSPTFDVITLCLALWIVSVCPFSSMKTASMKHCKPWWFRSLQGWNCAHHRIQGWLGNKDNESAHLEDWIGRGTVDCGGVSSVCTSWLQYSFHSLSRRRATAAHFFSSTVVGWGGEAAVTLLSFLPIWLLGKLTWLRRTRQRQQQKTWWRPCVFYFIWGGCTVNPHYPVWLGSWKSLQKFTGNEPLMLWDQ